MFTGLVESVAPVAGVTRQEAGLRLQLDLGPVAEGLALGASVAVAGCCLTVAALDGSRADFDVSPETLSKTRLGEVQPGQGLNVERSLRAGDPLGGHFVSGHVDGVGRFLGREAQGDYEIQRFSAPPAVAALLIPKGSVAVEGVSLTVAELTGDDTFTVALIPETLSRTTLGRLEDGAAVHMEGDLLGKFVFAFLERRGAAGNPVP